MYLWRVCTGSVGIVVVFADGVCWWCLLVVFAGGGVCGPGGESLNGVITVNPQQKLLVKDLNTIEQSVCEGDPMVPIEYDFYGSAASASFTPTLNLPDGVEGKYTPRKQIMNIYLTGTATGSASQTYSTYIYGLQFSFFSNAVVCYKN